LTPYHTRFDGLPLAEMDLSENYKRLRGATAAAATQSQATTADVLHLIAIGTVKGSTIEVATLWVHDKAASATQAGEGRTALRCRMRSAALSSRDFDREILPRRWVG